MKKILSVFLIGIVSISLCAQESINQINRQLTYKTWVDGETREINSYQVSRVNGADYGNSRNSSTGMITSIAYHDADAENNAPFLEFYITRYEQSLANMKWFMIIIRGEDDKDKLLEQKLDYKAAQLPEGNYYWNYTTIPIPENIHPPFYVYIRDRNLPQLTSFKFKVE